MEEDNIKFRSLPPLKRLRLLQQQHHIHDDKENAPISFQLPAKKRKESRHQLLPESAIASSFSSSSSSTYTTYSLPAKKRVFALQPHLLLGNPLAPLDLNIEYKPPFDQKFQSSNHNNECPPPIVANTFVEMPQLVKKEEEIPLLKENVRDLMETEEDVEDDDGIVCAICQSTDGDPTDPIVFCDGCDLMVHSTCYGNPLIKGVPDGDWFCTQCLVSQTEKPNKAYSCCLCPTKTGALKPTENGLWAHIVCAVLVPEVFFEDPDGREGINCSKVPKRRWEDKCYVCKTRKGCVIHCSEPKCPLAFHITCGLNQDLCFEYKQGKKKEEAIVAGFCETHTELWKKQQQTGKFKIVAREKQSKEFDCEC